MQKLKLAFIVVILFSIAIISCKKNNQAQQNPNNQYPVNITIYKTDPQFFNLNVVTGWIYVNGGGKGIIVFRSGANDFKAFERECPHEGKTNASAILYFNNTQQYMFDTICKSRFSPYDGSIMQTPSAYPATQYNTSWDGNILRIFN